MPNSTGRAGGLRRGATAGAARKRCAASAVTVAVGRARLRAVAVPRGVAEIAVARWAHAYAGALPVRPARRGRADEGRDWEHARICGGADLRRTRARTAVRVHRAATPRVTGRVDAAQAELEDRSPAAVCDGIAAAMPYLAWAVEVGLTPPLTDLTPEPVSPTGGVGGATGAAANVPVEAASPGHAGLPVRAHARRRARTAPRLAGTRGIAQAVG